MRNSEPYHEKRLQIAALAWAHNHFGYRAIADDVEATGDPMDAIGMLGNELVAIETKVDVHKGTVWFNPKVSGTIEPKIAKTLAGLYRGETHGQVGVIESHWERDVPLTIIILAGNYSATGLKALLAMLDLRSKEWHFRYRVWRWAVGHIEEVARATSNDAPVDLNWASISVPEMTARPPRSQPATMEELREIAIQGRMLETFDAIVARSRDLKMKRTRRVSGFNLHTGGAVHSLWCSIFVTEGDLSNGLNCGVDAELFTRVGLPLPGTNAPRAGYMNTNRFIRSNDDVNALFAPFCSEASADAP